MSKRYLGGVITANPATPTGSFQDSAAPGMWTSAQQMQLKAAGLWPLFGNANPSQFIENLFSTYLYTGNSSTQTITNGIDLAGKGGAVWIKQRNGTGSHEIRDTVRGSNKAIYPNSTIAEGTSSVLSAFTSSGFSLNGLSYNINEAGSTYGSWTSREQPKFFDIVTYTGDGVAGRTVAHSLNAAPGFIVVKRTNSAGGWNVYHRSLGATQTIFLNATDAAFAASNRWNDTAPTSTNFTLGADPGVNNAGSTYVAYIYAHNAGGFGLSGNENVVSCGNFTTGAYLSVTTVNLGYEPQWIMVKSTADENWYIVDNMRGMPVGAVDATLNPNLSNAESLDYDIVSPTATGFTTIAGSSLSTSATYIYIAIRRGPMAVPTLGTSVFAPFNTSVTSNPQSFTTNFPVDFAFTRKSNGNAEQIATSKLQNGYYMDTTNTNAEQTVSYYKFDSNTSISSSYHNPGFGTVQSMLAMRRAPSFMDEVCFTDDGTGTQVVNHNLSVVPEMIIVKVRSNVQSWPVYITTGPKSLRLNTTEAAGSSSLSPTATTFNAPGYPAGWTVVAYLFATCPGVSKVGSYTGTGTTLAINCGFTTGVRFVLIKRTDSTGDWYYWDSARGIVAGDDPYLRLNSALGEVTGTDYVDTSAAGFEISSTAPAEINASGGSYIFLAIS